MKCRGTETRKKIVQEYYVEPVAHLKLLANQRKYSDAEAIIEGEYYIFIATRKQDGYKDIIQCGMGAARDFLKILGHKGLSLFNPLEENYDKSQTNDSVPSNSSSNKNWNPIAKQLYNAIMWIIMLWNAKPGTPLFDFRDDVEKYKALQPFDWKIKRVNTAIVNGGKGKNLTEIINDYRKDNTFKNSMCEFDLLESRIAEMIDENGNKLKSFF